MTAPVVFREISEVRQAVKLARRDGKLIGFVPTMGALHAGHTSLMEAARRDAGFVLVSIFVNPAQFGPKEDFSRYPRTFDDDLKLCATAGVDAIFAPEAATIYPAGFRTAVEVQGWQDQLCGASRQGHFRGVATVVLKLLNIVQPDLAYFGQKDAQQALILRRMVRDLDVPVQLRILPTIREPDGLALSSRNRYLDPDQRRQAPRLWQALQRARQRIDAGERDALALQQLLMAELNTISGARLDYVQVVDEETLETPLRLHGQILIALAVFFGTTRLIDNIQVEVPN